MFRGAAAVNLDAKGRVAIPTRYRAEIMEKNQGQMVCTVDIRQPCLLLYPLDEWEKIEQKLLSLSNFDPNQRRLQRVMLAQIDEDIEIGSSAEFGASEELKMLSL